MTCLYPLDIDSLFVISFASTFSHSASYSVLSKISFAEKKLLSLIGFHLFIFALVSFTFSSVSQSCPTLCDPMNRSTPGLPVHPQLPEFTQTHARQVSDAIQLSHPLLPPSPPAPNPSQHQGLFQWVNSLHEVAKVREFQLQHQSFQWTPRTDLLCFRRPQKTLLKFMSKRALPMS